ARMGRSTAQPCTSLRRPSTKLEPEHSFDFAIVCVESLGIFGAHVDDRVAEAADVLILRREPLADMGHHFDRRSRKEPTHCVELVCRGYAHAASVFEPAHDEARGGAVSAGSRRSKGLAEDRMSDAKFALSLGPAHLFAEREADLDLVGVQAVDPLVEIA